MRVGDKEIDEKSPCYIIAEACVNHMGKIETAKELALSAKNAGANSIKFQYHIPDEEMLKEVPNSENFDEPLYEILKKLALKHKEHEELIKYCKEINITYLCTPFSYKAAEKLNTLGITAFKIGSGEFMDFPFLKKIGEFNKPLILSTGMCSLKEIDETVEFLNKNKIEFALMNCTSEYPPVYEDINLNFIPFMKSRYKKIIGHSDHTPDIYTSFAAVSLGAKIIEKHFILDKTTPSPDRCVSIVPSELKMLVDGIRKIEAGLKSDKKLKNKEKEIRNWAYRSVVTIKDIKKGETLTQENIWTKRPGTGIPAKEYFSLIGKKAKKDLEKDTIIERKDIK